MKLAILALFFAIPAKAGVPPASQPGGSDCTTNCTFTSVTTNGTSPSLTATGGVFTGSVTALSGGLAVAGQSGTVVRIGTITNTASANPTQLSLGGPYNNSAAGNTLKSKLLVYDDGTSGAGLSFSSTGDGTSLEYNTSGGFDHTWYNGGVEAMRLTDSTRRLGLGTSAPGSKFHVQAGSITSQGAGAGIRVWKSDASDNLPVAGFYRGGLTSSNYYDGFMAGEGLGTGQINTSIWGVAGDAGYIEGLAYNSAAANLKLNAAAGGNVLVPNASSKVGIGTASPNAKLDVTGAAMFGTGGTQSTFTATGFFQPYSRTTLQLSLLAPSAVGQYIDNSTIGALCRSTGTSAGNWALATAAGTGCF